MEFKKNPQHVLEHRRFAFLQIGLIVALGIVLLSFEWTSYTKQPMKWKAIELEEVHLEVLPQITLPSGPSLPKKTIYTSTAWTILDIKASSNSKTSSEEKTIQDDFSFFTDEAEPLKDESNLPRFVPSQKEPSFVGGRKQLYAYLSNNIHYPKSAKLASIEGKVLVGFTIDEEGNVVDVRVIHGIGGGCDEEAMRVVRAMPAWKPGENNGIPVRVSMKLPINFALKE